MLTGTLTGSRGACEEGVGTGTNITPPYAQFQMPVLKILGHPTFGGVYDDEGLFVTLGGRFVNGDASGTVSYTDEGGCNIGPVLWTAHPLATS